MTKLKLLMASLALIVGGAIPAHAYTVRDLTSDGWSQVTTEAALQTAITDGSYFAIVSGRGTDLMLKSMSYGDNNMLLYQSVEDPLKDPGYAWIIEYSDSKYYLKNLNSEQYYFGYESNASWSYIANASHTSTSSATCNLTVSVSEGKYTLATAAGGTDTYIGPWDANAFNKGMRCAGNKPLGNADNFLVYAISKSSYAAKQQAIIEAATPTDVKDVTFLIKDANLDVTAPCSPWTGGVSIMGDASYGSYVSEKYHTANTNIYQKITGLKNGVYSVSAQGTYRQDNGSTDKAVLYAGTQTADLTLYTTIDVSSYSGNDATKVQQYLINHPDTKATIDNVVVTDGTLTLGIKTEAENAANLWIVYDNFTLTLTDLYVSSVATSFTSGNTMTAGQWYSFTVPTNGDYTLSATEGVVYTVGDALVSQAQAAPSAIVLKAGDVLYLKSSSTQTLTITHVEPVVADGDYYLYDAATQQFLSRGSSWGTKAVLDKYGLPFTWNNYNIIFKDANNGLYLSDGILYTDGTAIALAFTATDDETGYYLQDATHSQYLGLVDGDYKFISDKASAQVWTVKTKAEHDAILAGYTAQNYTNVSTAASLSGVTSENFLSYLSTNYAAKDKTSLVGTAKFSGSAGVWTYTSTRGDAATYGTNWTEAYSRTGAWTQTITGLDNGIYKVTVNGFERDGGYASCNTLGNAGYEIVTAYFKANDEQVQLKSWYSEREETNNPNSTDAAATAFNNDKYKNEVYAYVPNGSLTLTVAKPSYVWDDWVLFNNVTLTYYDNSVSSEDITAILAEATTQIAKPMYNEYKTVITSAKSALEADGGGTIANYNALRAAIDNSQSSVDSYAALKTYLDYIEENVLNTTNFYDATAKATIYDTPKSGYDNGTLTNAQATDYTIVKGGNTHYTCTAALLQLPLWKKDGTAALSNSGFYVNTWSTENKGTGDAADFANPFYEYYKGSGSLDAATIEGTMTGLTANKAYTVTAKVRVLGSSKVAGSITMQVKGGAAVDVTAGSVIMDGETNTGRYIGTYTATGVTDGDGNLVLTFNVAANSNISWLSFRDVNYAESEEEVSNDFTALNSAISSVEGALGFENGEYAPYNNLNKVNALLAAKSLDQNSYYIASIISNATTTLNNTAWQLQNTTEVNGFRWSISDFPAQDETSTDAGGFNFSNARISHNSETNKGLEQLNDAMCLHVQASGTGTYGATSGYTLPLKGSTVYALTFAYAGWRAQPGTSGTPSVTVKNAGGTTIATESLATTSILGNSTTDAWPTATVKFTTGEAGNYTIVFGATNDRVAYGDLSLLKAETVNATMAANAGKFGTFIAPFDVTIPDGIEAYTVTEENDGKLTLEAVETTIPANTAVLVKNNNTSYYSETFSGQSLATADSYTTGLLTGVYTDATIPASADNTTNYVLQTAADHTQAFYKVDAAFTATPNRCYLTVTTTTGEAKPRVLYFDEVDATAINGIDAASTTNGAIYNLNGQQLNSLQRGINIVNGKKVLVK